MSGEKPTGPTEPDFPRDFLRGPTRKEAFEYLDSLNTGELWRILETEPEKEQAEAEGFKINSRFNEVRDLLPNNNQTDPVLNEIDLLEMSGFGEGERNLDNNQVATNLRSAALIKSFDYEKFNKHVGLGEGAWDAYIKPFLDWQAKTVQMKNVLSNAVKAKILFPRKFKSYQLPAKLYESNFFYELHDWYHDHDWELLLPEIEKLKFLGWEGLGPNIVLGERQWSSVLNTLNKPTKSHIVNLQKIHLVNLVRPEGQRPILASGDQWNNALTQLAGMEKRPILNFLEAANKLKYVEVAK